MKWKGALVDDTANDRIMFRVVVLQVVMLVALLQHRSQAQVWGIPDTSGVDFSISCSCDSPDSVLLHIKATNNFQVPIKMAPIYQLSNLISFVHVLDQDNSHIWCSIKEGGQDGVWYNSEPQEVHIDIDEQLEQPGAAQEPVAPGTSIAWDLNLANYLTFRRGQTYLVTLYFGVKVSETKSILFKGNPVVFALK